MSYKSKRGQQSKNARRKDRREKLAAMSITRPTSKAQAAKIDATITPRLKLGSLLYGKYRASKNTKAALRKAA